MKCPQCQKTITDNFKFCPECGTENGIIPQINLESILETATAQDYPGKKQIEGQNQTSMATQIADPAAMAVPSSIEYSATIEHRYHIIEQIGRGGFAVVFKARDEKLGDRIVAVKRMIKKNPLETDLARTAERFLRESSVIASLNHRNIVTVFDCNTDSDGHYIVMEYIDGGSLRDYLEKKGKLPPKEALLIVKGVSRGLSYAHRKNLIHRDIKPSNIMLSFEGDECVPKIVDFGLARKGEESDLSISGFGMGTPFYMSPEQRRGIKNVNHTTDIYAVGKLLYELVTGDIPDNVHPDLLSDHPDLADVIFKCLKTQPEERYFSADDLLKEIEELLKAPEDNATKPRKAGPDPSKNICPVCSLENNDDSKFCAGCGNGLFRICPECGKESSSHKNFCAACGVDMDAILEMKKVHDEMEGHARMSNWADVLKVYGDVSFANAPSTEKVKALISKIKELADSAKNGHKEELCYHEAIQNSAAFQAKDKFSEANHSLHSYLSLYPKGKYSHEIRERVSDFKKQSYKGPASGKPWSVPGMNLGFSLVNSGEFMMGSNPGGLFGMGGEKGRRKNEAPVHRAKITHHFWMGKCTVTIADYLKYMCSYEKDTIIQWTSKNCPVEKAGKTADIDNGCWADMSQPIVEVSWYAAVSFCKWLTDAEKAANRLPENYEYRLPTETEWEYCCRAGSQGRFCFGDDEKYLKDYAWFDASSDKKTHPVGLKKPNELGLFDMHGNVWEWCHDFYDSYHNHTSVNSTGPSRGTVCVRRGGSWVNDADHCRSAYRNCWEANTSFLYLGFRIVLAPYIKTKNLFLE